MNTNEPEAVYTLKQAGEILRVSTQELRRLCDAGLIRRLKRTITGYRLLDGEQLDMMRKLLRLKRCGFGVADLKMYMKLEQAGDVTLAERKRMLETKRRQIWQTIEECQENIDYIERQVEIFDQTLERNSIS